MKFNHQIFLGNLLTRSTNFTVFLFFFPPAVIFMFKISLFFSESTFLFFVREFDVWSKTVHQHFIKKNRTVSQGNSTICHYGWRTTTRQHLSRAPLEGVMSTTKHACTGPRNYRSGHLCCDELYSSPDELLLVKWTSVFFSQKIFFWVLMMSFGLCVYECVSE